VGTISRNFSWSEFERTSHEAELAKMGVRNVINTFEIRDAVISLVTKVLQPIRNIWGKPMTVGSGYRCPELNKMVGGVPTSQHQKGEAADISLGNMTEVYRMGRLIKTTPEIFREVDQLILYGTFCHISHRRVGKQRNMILYDKTYKGRRI
jgi:hypothetical protein